MLRPIASRSSAEFCALLSCAFVLGVSHPAPAAPPSQAPIILDCNFDDKPLDTVIGTGGAVANEPVDLNNLPATVRSTPFPTPSLQMIDDSGSGARHVRFQFLDNVEITTGIVETKMSVSFEVLDRYSVLFREVGTNTSVILSLDFEATGEIYYKDLDTSSSTMIGTYTAGTEIPIRIRHDLDLNECTLKVGDVVLLDGESIGPMTRGIGAILIGVNHDTNSLGTMSLDDLLVTATSIPTAVDATSWGRLKTLYR